METTLEFSSFKNVKQESLIFNEIKVSYKRKTQGKVLRSIDCYNYIKPLFNDTIDFRESFIALYLNRSNNIIGHFVVSVGGINGTVVDPRLVFSPALACLASHVILFHNHPSGNTQPSNEDIAITKKLKSAGAILEMSVIDHIILTEESYFSFADEGII